MDKHCKCYFFNNILMQKKWELLINTSMIARSIEMVPIDKILIEVKLIVWWIINGWCKEHWPLGLEKKSIFAKMNEGSQWSTLSLNNKECSKTVKQNFDNPICFVRCYFAGGQEYTIPPDMYNCSDSIHASLITWKLNIHHPLGCGRILTIFSNQKTIIWFWDFDFENYDWNSSKSVHLA